MSMFTDPKRIKRTDPGNPKICNVFNYYQIFSDLQVCGIIENQCRNAEIGCTDCKQQFAQRLNDYLKPIQEKRKKLSDDQKKINEILETGCKKARAVAKTTMRQVKEMIGL